MTELHKLKDRALDASSRGLHRKAAEIYTEIVSREPGADWRMRAGEAARRAGLLPLAIEHFTVAAEAYAGEGFPQKAIAVARLILQLEPGREDTMMLLESLRRDGTPLASLRVRLE